MEMPASNWVRCATLALKAPPPLSPASASLSLNFSPLACSTGHRCLTVLYPSVTPAG